MVTQPLGEFDRECGRPWRPVEAEQNRGIWLRISLNHVQDLGCERISQMACRLLRHDRLCKAAEILDQRDT
jgi:hypothetical protein